MSKLHASLSPAVNLLLIVAWAIGVVILLVVPEPRAHPAIAIVGGVLGLLGGIMQHLSARSNGGSFASTASWLEVRRTFRTTVWGRRYLRFLYASKIILLTLAFVLVRRVLLGAVYDYAAGYLALMCVREIATLPDILSLHRLARRTRDLS